MSTATLLSEQEYLRTDYEWPPEFVNGVLEERPMPTWSHAEVQAALSGWFIVHHPELRPLSELRYRVSAGRYRVPDLVVVPRSMPAEETLETAPRILVEILSPDDRLPKVLKKLREYAEAGVPAIWVLDPESGSGYQFTESQGLKFVEDLTAERGVRLSVADFFGTLSEREL